MHNDPFIKMLQSQGYKYSMRKAVYEAICERDDNGEPDLAKVMQTFAGMEEWDRGQMLRWMNCAECGKSAINKEHLGSMVRVCRILGLVEFVQSKYPRFYVLKLTELGAQAKIFLEL